MDSANDIQNKFCERCYYLITHFTNNEAHIDKTLFMNLRPSKNCNFCFGIFDMDSYSSMFSNIRFQLDEIDHKDFRFSINFSNIFDFIHHYWRHIFKTKNLVKNVNEINIDMIRVIFRQLFITLIEKGIHEVFNPHSDTEVELNFEFTQETYDKINDLLHYLGKKEKLVPNDYYKSTVNMNALLKSFPGGLVTEIFKKYDLVNLASTDVLLKNFRVLKQNLYIKGNYLKLTRDIGQTKWEINGVRVCPSSVEEEIKKKLKEAFNCDDCIMSAGGREDRDVRMLGSGRPFILEILNPKKNFLYPDKIEKLINENTSLVKVNEIGMCDKNYFEEIKKYEMSKMKYYSCVIWVEKEITQEDIDKINSIKDLKIAQKTPFRVLHRRTLMTRNKEVYKMEGAKINNHFMVLNILASAGTYIKEFVHSDLGRTNPSVMSILGCQCDILQLDVLNLVYSK